MNRAWIAACAALLLAAPAAQAGVGQGDIEAGVSLSLISQEIETEGAPAQKSDTGLISFSGGYFYSDQIQFKVALNMIITSDGTGGKTTGGSLNPGADYLFVSEGSDLVPFAGASYGLAIGDLDQSDFLEFHGGVKYFFRENTSLEVKLARHEPMDSDFDVGHTDLTVGLNFYF
jgi:hypothetical protein